MGKLITEKRFNESYLTKNIIKPKKMPLLNTSQKYLKLNQFPKRIIETPTNFPRPKPELFELENML
jgi:hypothetical protein